MNRPLRRSRNAFPRGGRWREAPDEECGQNGMNRHSAKTCDILPIHKSDSLTNLKGYRPHSSPAPYGGTL